MRRIVLAGEGLAAAFSTPAGALGPYLKLVFGAEGGRIVRTYSVRRLDAARDELHVDFALHDHAGPGAIFAREAVPGRTVALGGPGHIPAPAAREYRLAGDHTALPAIAHILEHLPPTAGGHAIVEVPHEAEIQPLPTRSAVELAWLVRRPGAPSRLAATLAAAPVRDGADAIVWAGAEAEVARAIRTHARSAWLVAGNRCQVLNYWKEGRPEGGFSYVA